MFYGGTWRASNPRRRRRGVRRAKGRDDEGVEGVGIRYDTRCYFNVRSKANMNQLNLPHGNRQLKSVKKTEKLKVENRYAIRNNSKQRNEWGRGIPPSQPTRGFVGSSVV